jgi:hypothetical protein
VEKAIFQNNFRHEKPLVGIKPISHLFPSMSTHSSGNIFCNKVSAFPDSSVGCCMQDKAQEFKKNKYGPLPVLGLPV